MFLLFIVAATAQPSLLLVEDCLQTPSNEVGGILRRIIIHIFIHSAETYLPCHHPQPFQTESTGAELILLLLLLVV